MQKKGRVCLVGPDDRNDRNIDEQPESRHIYSVWDRTPMRRRMVRLPRGSAAVACSDESGFDQHVQDAESYANDC